jgi:hypothetical protein
LTIEILNPVHLRPHPELQRLFAPLLRSEQDRLKQDMAQGRPFAPLLIDQEGLILAGVEQWQVALELGWDRISALRAPRMNSAQARSLMVAENIRAREIREEHLWRGMNNFFDMEPLRPPGGW